MFSGFRSVSFSITLLHFNDRIGIIWLKIGRKSQKINYKCNMPADMLAKHHIPQNSQFFFYSLVSNVISNALHCDFSYINDYVLTRTKKKLQMDVNYFCHCSRFLLTFPKIKKQTKKTLPHVLLPLDLFQKFLSADP